MLHSSTMKRATEVPAGWHPSFVRTRRFGRLCHDIGLEPRGYGFALDTLGRSAGSGVETLFLAGDECSGGPKGGSSDHENSARSGEPHDRLKI